MSFLAEDEVAKKELSDTMQTMILNRLAADIELDKTLNVTNENDLLAAMVEKLKLVETPAYKVTCQKLVKLLETTPHDLIAIEQLLLKLDYSPSLSTFAKIIRYKLNIYIYSPDDLTTYVNTVKELITNPEQLEILEQIIKFVFEPAGSYKLPEGFTDKFRKLLKHSDAKVRFYITGIEKYLDYLVSDDEMPEYNDIFKIDDPDLMALVVQKNMHDLDEEEKIEKPIGELSPLGGLSELLSAFGEDSSDEEVEDSSDEEIEFSPEDGHVESSELIKKLLNL